jgi:hypothetical protein
MQSRQPHRTTRSVHGSRSYAAYIKYHAVPGDSTQLRICSGGRDHRSFLPVLPAALPPAITW